MLIINLFGGPGTGKSTTAAKVFARLKDLGIKVELITEYPKDLVYEGRLNNDVLQLSMMAEQVHRQDRLIGKVDVAVTDCPILSMAFYATVYKDRSVTPHFIPCLVEQHKRFNSLNVTLKRIKPYAKYGRTQTEGEARGMDEPMHLLVRQHCDNDSVISATGDDEGADRIVSEVRKRLNAH